MAKSHPQTPVGPRLPQKGPSPPRSRCGSCTPHVLVSPRGTLPWILGLPPQAQGLGPPEGGRRADLLLLVAVDPLQDGLLGLQRLGFRLCLRRHGCDNTSVSIKKGLRAQEAPRGAVTSLRGTPTSRAPPRGSLKPPAPPPHPQRGSAPLRPRPPAAGRSHPLHVAAARHRTAARRNPAAPWGRAPGTPHTRRGAGHAALTPPAPHGRPPSPSFLALGAILGGRKPKGAARPAPHGLIAPNRARSPCPLSPRGSPGSVVSEG